MVIVGLSGGLGNQMFQYAAARSVALANRASLKLDLHWFRNVAATNTARCYELHVFNTVQESASASEVFFLRGPDISRWPKVVKKAVDRAGLVRKSYIREQSFSFDPRIIDLRGDLYLDGFWQSPKYFAAMDAQIRADFTFSRDPDPLNLEIGETIKNCEAVSLHVRRGDYVSDPATNRYHGVSSMDYYAAAVAEMKARVAAPHFFVFSDEPQWVNEHLKLDAPTTYIGHNTNEKAYEDLRLMSLCKHHVIANSSFSWWGAWLSANLEKVVIAPRQWFAHSDAATDDLIPEGWLRL